METSGARMRILVVDDESAVSSLIAYKLRSLGYEVHTAQDGVEGLRIAEEVHPSVIILDVTMPHMNGYQVLERLRKGEAGRRVNVLMLTAHSQTDEVERGLLAGADDYLTKPFDLRELVARVKAAGRIQVLQEELLASNR